MSISYFPELCFLRSLFAFSLHDYDRFASIRQWIALAERSHFIDWERVSIVGIAFNAVCGAPSSLTTIASQCIVKIAMSIEPQVVHSLSDALPTDSNATTSFLQDTIGNLNHEATKTLLGDAMFHPYLERYRRFASRFMAVPESLLNGELAKNDLLHALATWDSTNWRFICWTLFRLLKAFPKQTIDGDHLDKLLNTVIDPDERGWLRRVHERLSVPERFALCSTVYCKLDGRELTECFSRIGSATGNKWNWHRVHQGLEGAWRKVLA